MPEDCCRFTAGCWPFIEPDRDSCADSFHLARPVLSLRPPVRFRPLLLKMLMLRPCDAESLRDAAAFEAIFESQRRAWRGSAEGVMADAQIYAQPWGFSLEDVQRASSPLAWEARPGFLNSTGRKVVKQLPNCKARFVKERGALFVAYPSHGGDFERPDFVLIANVLARSKRHDGGSPGSSNMQPS